MLGILSAYNLALLARMDSSTPNIAGTIHGCSKAPCRTCFFGKFSLSERLLVFIAGRFFYGN